MSARQRDRYRNFKISNDLNGEADAEEIDMDNRWSIIALSTQTFSKIYEQQVEHIIKLTKNLKRHANFEVEKQNDENAREERKSRNDRDRINDEMMNMNAIVDIDKINFEINFETYIDPFFKKTSQMFDEANASGLLLNNLHINREVMVSLDAQAPLDQNQRQMNQNIYHRRLVNAAKDSFKEAFKEQEMSMGLRDFILDLKDEINKQVRLNYQSENSRICKYVHMLASQFKPLRSLNQQVRAKAARQNNSARDNLQNMKLNNSNMPDQIDDGNFDMDFAQFQPSELLLHQDDFQADEVPESFADKLFLRKSGRQTSKKKDEINLFPQNQQNDTKKRRDNDNRRIRNADTKRLLDIFEDIPNRRDPRLRQQITALVNMSRNDAYMPKGLNDDPIINDTYSNTDFLCHHRFIQRKQYLITKPQTTVTMSREYNEYLELLSSNFDQRKERKIKAFLKDDYDDEEDYEDEQDQDQVDLIVDNDLDNDNYMNDEANNDQYYQEEQKSDQHLNGSQESKNERQQFQQENPEENGNESDNELMALFKDQGNVQRSPNDQIKQELDQDPGVNQQSSRRRQRRFKTNILNIRRIKETMNNYIGQENRSNNIDDLVFSDICLKTQNFIEEQDEATVNVQTSFLCLLHLANEKSYDLECLQDRRINLNDIKITPSNSE
ncbi:UNKNOWN [Stylonychia lemnae]|uniref:Condensin complex subunit 2 n=1 Tax=Stylonychia lemnae TaxID=5949 RepID=A0A078BB64_STYLE|nr:UNKNOWN [Stylonychia lemnae]|eukprot:CDW91431.1 UNKNOWN [Stylonychia lemnae]